jgi:hypothetical protein
VAHIGGLCIGTGEKPENVYMDMVYSVFKEIEEKLNRFMQILEEALDAIENKKSSQKNVSMDRFLVSEKLCSQHYLNLFKICSLLIVRIRAVNDGNASRLSWVAM